ncbi:KRAB [Lepeophtheirus salmonis]|uniref:KRAB n=2 Tax=Lepeophtheirus salmonis TaxID=72036 RepID=A0A7R8H967_LEPSM|nr:KRAB [Lepeophtheirus salmonis]CAF2953823.1 KRAB [Lepeophtheirus salmonis]
MPQNENWRSWILSEIKGSFESGFASDVIIKSREDHLIYSHRILLGSYSTFLRHVFLETPKEDDFAILLTPDISYSRIKSFLYTLYDENVPKSADHEVAALLGIDNWPFFQNEDIKLNEKTDLIPEIFITPHKDSLIDFDPNLFPEDVNEFIKRRVLDQSCPICKLDFIFHNQDGKGLFCCECGKEFECHKRLQEHAEKVHLKSYRNWTCLLCNKTMGEHRNKDERRCVYRCCTCTRSKFKFIALKSHLSSHLLKNFKCSSCKKCFYKSEGLRNHVADAHSIQLSCSYTGCTFNTNYKQTLTTHVKELHEGIKRSHNHPSGKEVANCPHCFKTFKKRYLDQTHRRVCLNNKSRIEFKCESCGKSGFVNKTTLNNHIRTVHQGDTPYECVLCPKNNRPTYATSMALLAHTSRKHRKASVKNNSSRLYPCNLCGKLLSSTSNLKSHKNTIHRKERNFACTYCAKCFSSKSNLQIHEGALHTGILPYKCKDCSESFTRKSSLENHISTVHGKFSPIDSDGRNSTNLQNKGNDNCTDVTDFFRISTD